MSTNILSKYKIKKMIKGQGSLVEMMALWMPREWPGQRHRL